ncbi:UNVERIFIED_CONTAM: Phospho-2-dehydro-3-deoxyheptonate aldolase 1, chloroplastic [Sesamum latifolium]|uniref:Phospho-2-dehydro-3-deoxyheptonate aldolase n=1 Tax=Sesamum latifolium TaxID=2727402 RepID=A0AAW2VUW4_9LAMI
MALAPHSSLLPTSSSPFPQTQSALYVSPSSLAVKSAIKPISAVHSADSSTSQTTTIPAASVGTKVAPKKWALDSWKSKKALQLPEYPNQEDLESVLRTLDAFPPIVFAGEARSLEERLGEAAMGNAFLLQGGDCAELQGVQCQ